MLKVTKKVNHDSLWLKIQDTKTKSWSKVVVNRRGVRVDTKNTPEKRDEFRGYAKRMFEHMTSEAKGTYGEKLDSLEVEMQSLVK